MNHTTNYALNQWSRTDQVRMDDFNADNAKLDAALAAQAGTLAAHTEALSKLGNCRVHLTSYMGTGVNKYDSNGIAKPEDCPQIPLPGVPTLLFVFGRTCIMYYTSEFTGSASLLVNGKDAITGIAWEDSTAILKQANSNYSSYLNQKAKYWVLAIYPAE